MKRTIIYLTNLTHVSGDGILATESIPLNLGYLATYVESILGGEVEIELFHLPLDLVEAVRRKRPHILAGSNYSWNAALSYHYLAHFKKMYPDIITVMGGPTFSINPERRKEFLLARPHLDFYVTDEGELAFAGLVQSCIRNNMDAQKVRDEIPAGCHFLESGQLISGARIERMKDINVIPSPYLNGHLDKFLDQGLTPILQSNRGCPFGCAYCCSSVSYYNKITFFNVDRVKEEIEYIADRVKSPTIHIHDDNFGMFNQDYEICLKFKEMQEKRKWPVFISAATGKNSKEKILRCIELLGPSIPFSASVQTTSKRALELIGRDNMNLSDFLNIQKRIKEVGGESSSELILPLPGETLETHLEAIKTIMAAGIDRIGPYTTMVLPASPLSEDKRFAEEQMVFKYRVVPRDFGVYEGSVVIEVETVCVATRDLSFDQYLRLRELHFMIYCIYNGDVFKELLHYLKGVGVPVYDYICRLWTRIENAPESARKVFNQFLGETKDELWDSEMDLRRYYSDSANYQKLVSHERGGNLLQKYNGLFFSGHFGPFSDYIFDQAKGILDDRAIQCDRSALEALRTYILSGRAGLFDIDSAHEDVELLYDVQAWKDEHYSQPLERYKSPVRLRFSRTVKQVNLVLDYLKIYGGSVDGKGKILARLNPRILFREIEVIS